MPEFLTVAVMVSIESNLLITENGTLTTEDEDEDEEEIGSLSTISPTVVLLSPPFLIIILLYWKEVYDRP